MEPFYFGCQLGIKENMFVLSLVSILLFLVQLQPSSIYLKEDDTKNAEFPEDGRFVLLSAGTRYKLCGDEDIPGNESDRISMETPPSRSLVSVVGPGGSGHSGWSIPRPWQQQQQQQRDSDIQMGPGPSSKRQKTMPYESSLKHSFPFVSLCLDESGRNICVDTIVSNVNDHFFQCHCAL